MAEEVQHSDGRIENPRVRYELSDASFPWIVGLLVGAALLGALIYFGITLFFNHTRHELDLARKSSFPLAPLPSGALPPEPRLEQIDRMSKSGGVDENARLQANLDMLNTFGPTDAHGFVHIPVSAAMRALANKLPVRSQVEEANRPARDYGLVNAGASNSGRVLRRTPRWYGR